MKAVNRDRNYNGGAGASSTQHRPSKIISGPPKATNATAVELRGITVHFPFQPYDCQLKYMGKVLDALNLSENALLESPTGTGKTLCLLCSTLAWQREQARLLPQNMNKDSLNSQPVSVGGGASSTTSAQSSAKRVPTIIYASRTHSQLSQVIRELQNTRYRPRHTLLGSRDHMCVNPKVKTNHATGYDINYKCGQLAKERKCSYRNNLEGFRPQSTEFGSNHTQPVMDMEDLVTMGKKRRVCPFYYTRSKVADAELILVPYNYLFDRESRESTLKEVPWDNAIIIFDEAHNLESFASESASFDLTTTDIAGCISEIDKAFNFVHAIAGEQRINPENLLRLKHLFMELEAYIVEKLSNDRSVYSGEFMMEIFKHGASITWDNHEIFVRELKKVIDIILELRSPSASGMTKLESFIGCIKHIFGEVSEGRCFAKAQAYRVHITPKQSVQSAPRNGPPGSAPTQAVQGRTVSYWCFAPSLAMQELSNLNVRSVIVTSGTLSPLPSYSLELGLSFPHTLENPHIIKDDQIHVRVIGKGVSGKLLSSSYERRQDGEYITELGNTLVNLARVVPGGMLVFFPSYGVMETCVERWGGPSSGRRQNAQQSNRNAFFAARRKRSSGSNQSFSFPHAPNYHESHGSSNPWRRMLCQKSIILEPKTTASLPEAIADFRRFLNQDKSSGCILMGVCRGKISEGIDFAHNMCRAVVVTGLPFSPYLDPKVKLKREFLDKARAGHAMKSSEDGGFGDASVKPVGLSGSEWYSQQAHRAVNQAIGRVIRNRHDYGAVLLLDSRFSEQRNQNGLSCWVRTRIKNDEGFGKAISTLARFYKEAKEHVESREAKPLHAQARRLGSELKYEDEDDDVKNIALVAVSSKHGKTEVDISRGYVPKGQVMAEFSLEHGQESLDQPESGHRDLSERPAVSNLSSLYNDEERRERVTTSSSFTKMQASGTWDSIDTTRKDPPVGTVSKQVPTDASAPSKPGSKAGNAATGFFNEARRACSAAEFAVIRKAVVAMKQGLDGGNRMSYLKAAREIFEVLVKHDNFDSKGLQLKLHEDFCRLQPMKWRKDIQKASIKSLFQASAFFRICKDSKTSATVHCLLRELHFSEANRPMSRAQFLERTRSVLNWIESTNNSQAGHSFVNLLPQQYKTLCYDAMDQIKVAKEVQIMKERERSMLGENGVDSTRFRSRRGATVNSTDTTDNETPDAQHQLDMQGSLMFAMDLNRKKRQMIEEARIQDCLRKRPPKPSGDEIGKFVDAASVPIISKMDKLKTMKTNAPKDLTCSICDEFMKQPIKAECGHLACSSCWKKWLSRSGSCPRCRAPVAKGELARVVFEKRENVNVDPPMSLSQLLSRSSEASKGKDRFGPANEEELEIL